MKAGSPWLVALIVGLLVSTGFVASVRADVGDESDPSEAIERHYALGPVEVDLIVRPAKPRIGDVVELRLEAVARDGSVRPFEVDLETVIAIFGEAVSALPTALKFSAKPGEPLATLTPSPKLVHLVRKSRDLAATGAELEGA